MTDKEKEPYHKIMTSAWRIFIKERKAEKYSDDWWEEIIGEYEKLRERYKGTDLDDYVCQINQTFLDEYERGMKHGRQKRVSEKLLPEQEEYHQAELQFPNTVSEVGGDKENTETLSAEDW